MPRYNIALIPTSLSDREYLQKYSQEKFTSISSGYLLGNKSLPHVSICQFECPEDEFKAIYPKIIDRLKDHTDRFYNLEINGINLINLGGQFVGQQAVEFNISRTSNLMDLHLSVIGLIKELKLAPLNAMGKQYRPHLTLTFFEPQRAGDHNIPKILPYGINHIRSFMVAVGEADLNWQFNRIITDFPKEKLETAPLGPVSGKLRPAATFIKRTIVLKSLLTYDHRCYLAHSS